VAACDNVPLVPVTVARLLPATEPVQVRVEVPDPPVILVEVRVHDKLVELVARPRVIVPVKPFTGATVMVETPATPAFTVTLVRLAEIVKSWT
jgi:hypothetical protein